MNVEVILEYKNESGEWEKILDYIMGSKQPSSKGQLHTSDTTRYIYIPDTVSLTDPINGHKVIDINSDVIVQQDGETSLAHPKNFLLNGQNTVMNNLLHSVEEDKTRKSS